MTQLHNASVPRARTSQGLTPDEFFAFAEQVGAQMVDMKFCDLLGTWQHCSFPVDEWSADTFKDGLGFDGSSIRGWQDVHLSDMLAIPDCRTAVLDPFFREPTISVIADVYDPAGREPYSRDPRFVALKAERHMRSLGVAEVCNIGPEPEFFIFDEVRYEQTQHRGLYEIDSVEGAWNTARFEEPNLGYKPGYKGGYFPVSPTDTYGDLRSEMTFEMKKVGIAVEAHHHEVGTAGQAEIDMRYAPLLRMGDQFMWYKYIIKNVAKRHNKTVTFMPKPVFEDNGSGMHTHFSLWKDGLPLFAGDKYAGLSETALHAIGGILRHVPSLAAFTNPTTNSYRRLTPGFEAPVNLVYSSRNRSAAIRIPIYHDSPEARRIECRFPDPTCNGYLAWSALLMAALDGIVRQIDPGEPLDRNIYQMSEDDLVGVGSTPEDLDSALQHLAEDRDYLLAGGAFTEDLIQAWIDWKMDNEVKPLRLRPHPHEFHLYYDS
ncbi:MAG: type I glutamate--ammonia ligase [Phycisphaerales bacterium]|nr:MAG: type I glutamate--ammonia ligase [Phycisphaerales bacterium]